MAHGGASTAHLLPRRRPATSGPPSEALKYRGSAKQPRPQCRRCSELRPDATAHKRKERPAVGKGFPRGIRASGWRIQARLCHPHESLPMTPKTRVISTCWWWPCRRSPHRSNTHLLATRTQAQMSWQKSGFMVHCRLLSCSAPWRQNVHTCELERCWERAGPASAAEEALSSHGTGDRENRQTSVRNRPLEKTRAPHGSRHTGGIRRDSSRF